MLEESFDVTDAIGSGESLRQSGWMFLPNDPAHARGVLVCLPGGSYDKRYWHMEIPGHPGYSFAQHLTSHGFVVVSIDHLAVGDSSDPHESGDVDLQLLARGDAAVADQIRQRLNAGTLAAGIPPLRLPLIGVGHSFGACLTAVVQANHHVFDAVVLLGFAGSVTNVVGEKVDDADPDTRVRHMEAVVREQSDAAPDAAWVRLPREALSGVFYAQDVPDDVIAADTAAETRGPVRALAETALAGDHYIPYAEKIDVPVFLGFGDIDLSPDPLGEPRYYRTARDLTLYLLPGSGHCHNFATNRAALWDRIASWVPAAAAAA
ncbi:alpha/beta hydrolase [Rugosimonospora acidiphila]